VRVISRFVLRRGDVVSAAAAAAAAATAAAAAAAATKATVTRRAMARRRAETTANVRGVTTAQSDFCNDGKCGSDDPIIVDLTGAGFALTNARNGVKFDFFGTGKPIQMPWTAAGSSSGWLALDRKGNGLIDNGADLFSNVAPQPDSPARAKLGFRALAVYDLPANGGTGTES